MYKITNIDALGTNYSVVDRSGKIIQTIQVVSQDEILEAAIGEWEEGTSISKYLNDSIAVLAGFEDMDSNTTLWYATSDEETQLATVIEYAVKHGYERIIVEQLDLTDDDGMSLESNLLE